MVEHTNPVTNNVSDAQMTNAIDQCYSLEQVVETINGAPPNYGVANDTREPEVMAGQYAWEAACEAGYTSNHDIECHLDVLCDAGAVFDYGKAFANAVERRRRTTPDAAKVSALLQILATDLEDDLERMRDALEDGEFLVAAGIHDQVLVEGAYAKVVECLGKGVNYSHQVSVADYGRSLQKLG